MNIPGSLSVTPQNPLNSQDLSLRPFQRITAQILAVSDTTAVLSIEGYPVVAQLSSPDQAAALLAQRTAQFIVTQMGEQVMTLKFVKNDQGASQPAPGGTTLSSAPELAARILEQNGIPVTENSLMLARSALKQNLPITPQMLNELIEVLSSYGSWGDAEVELAAALKAAGLPVTSQSLALASRQSAPPGQALANLITTLSNALTQNLPEQTLLQLKSSLQMLKEAVVKWSGETGQLSWTQMKASVEMLGRSIENILLAQTQNPEAALPEQNLATQSQSSDAAQTAKNMAAQARDPNTILLDKNLAGQKMDPNALFLDKSLLSKSLDPNAILPEKSLISLVKLQQMLAQDGKNDLAKEVGEFLGDIRQNQFFNIKPDPVPGRGEWSEIGFLLQRPPQTIKDEFSSARLKIAHETGQESGKINPAYTRLLIQVDVKPGETVEVDISLVDNQIRTSMTAPDPLWVKNAQTELPSLEEALIGLGYILKDAQIGVGFPQPFKNLSNSAGRSSHMTVDIEV